MLRVVVIAAPASLVVELLLWPALGARFVPGAVAWGAASGLASAAAFALLYRTLAIGPMSVLSPVTALVSAALRPPARSTRWPTSRSSSPSATATLLSSR